ncbi:hypothetical protein E4T50_02976 [Aureobasidium sp. EXF-12298]|nr:hypothetical protein E4T50_02976 [Aureobasidium sp. EXF-12298]
MSSTPPDLDQALVELALSSLSSTASKWSCPSEKFLRTHQTFFNDPLLSDIKIKIGNQEYFAHKLILVARSVWFVKALLGEFKVNKKESKQDVVDLGDDDDPDALVTMLKFCYYDYYDISPCEDGNESTDQHLAMYRLGDIYDIPELRREASRKLVLGLSPTAVSEPWQEAKMTDKTILIIQKILGPEAVFFADNMIKRKVFEHVIEHAKLLYKNSLFCGLLADGIMFNQWFGRDFVRRVGEMLSRLDSRRAHYLSATSSPGDAMW